MPGYELPMTYQNHSARRVLPDFVGQIDFAISAYEPWMAKADCLDSDPELFYPERGTHSGAEAKRICAHCPVATDCLQHAVSNHEPFGIWGGLTAKERLPVNLRRRGKSA